MATAGRLISKKIKERNAKRASAKDADGISALQKEFDTELSKGAGFGPGFIVGYNMAAKEYALHLPQLFKSGKDEFFWISDRELKKYFKGMLAVKLPAN